MQTQPADDDAAFTTFWGLIAAFRARPDAANAFTHCLPWEYAALCATLWRANAAMATAPPAAAAGGGWQPVVCYPANEHGRQQMSAAMWDSLTAGPDELVAAYEQARVPHPVESKLSLARCAGARGCRPLPISSRYSASA